MAMNIGNSKAQINVTPMIDVLLVLIIIFMVITPTTSRGLDALAPPQATDPAPPGAVSREIVISIARDGAIEINSQAVEAGALSARLKEIYRSHVNNHIFVRGDGQLDYETVAHVIDAARGAGWDRIGLMTK